MITNPTRCAALAVIGVLAVAAPARAAEKNEIRPLTVEARSGMVEVVIAGSQPPSYTVVRLDGPPRLVLDFANADVKKVKAIKFGQGGVVEVKAEEYEDPNASVGRIVVGLDGPRHYEVMSRENAVMVRVLSEAPGSTAAALSVSPETVRGGASENALPAPPLPPAPPTEGAASAALPAQDSTTEKDPSVVSRTSLRGPVKKPARALLSVKGQPDRLVFTVDGDMALVEVIELKDPPRLALDLYGVARTPRGPEKLREGAFRQIRFGKDLGKVRVVLDVEGAMPKYEVIRVPRGIAVVFPAAQKPGKETAVLAAKAPVRSVEISPLASSAATRVHLSDVKFVPEKGGARIQVVGKAHYTVSRPDARTVVLSLEGAQLPKKLERSLDTAAVPGPVLMVSSFNQPATGQVKVIATLRGPAEDRILETKEGLTWIFSEKQEPEKAHAKVEAREAEPEVAGFGTEAPSYALSGAPQARGYTGRRITLDFHDIEIRNLLRLIADVSKKNIVVADDVTGKVTVMLRNVPWDQALDLVLKSKGLGKEEAGNVIRIAKYSQIAEEQRARAEAEKARQPTLPLKVRIIPVNFSRAKDLALRVKDLLTERGTVQPDERTNVLIVKDVQEALIRIEGLVRNLDTEIPQVLIESRIVEASTNYTKSIGVQWGGTASASTATNNPTGLAFPANVVASGGASQTASVGSSQTPNYAVSLPAAVGDGQGGALGFIFGTAGSALNLNLRLSALEDKGLAKTVSAPKITTIDNMEATIGQGVSIPFSQTSASGVNTVFVEAKLELKVTPHVTADGSILLKISATNNQPDPQLTGANGQPSISKREAQTEVLVRDGETTVIGGIYTRTTSKSTAQVPFFGNLPILGYFFRQNSEEDDHDEMLIFITPRILNRRTDVGPAAAN